MTLAMAVNAFATALATFVDRFRRGDVLDDRRIVEVDDRVAQRDDAAVDVAVFRRGRVVAYDERVREARATHDDDCAA